MPSGSDAGQGTYEQVGALAEKLDDAGRQELAALLDALTEPRVGWMQARGAVAVRRWLKDAGWLE